MKISLFLLRSRRPVFLISALSLPAVALAQDVSTAAAVVAPAAVLSAVGDVRLDGPIAAIAKAGGDSAPSGDVRHLIAADLMLANLETPVTTRGRKTPKTWNFRARPEHLKIVKAAGFNVLTIANNHVWDYGREGFLDTLANLEKGKWAYVGGGRDREAAERVRVFVVNGIKVGVVGLTSTFPKEGWSGPAKPGVAYAEHDRVGAIVRRARPLCDVLVVTFHGGTELAEDPNDIQRGAARGAIDAGADLFLGHHPHVLQPVEVYKGKPVLYSLGNFLFVSPTPSTRPTVVVRATLGKEGVRRLELHPVDGNWGKPKPADPELAEQARAMLNRLGALNDYPELLSFVAGGLP